MAKASRSKKQPDFDPSELDDLIFSPAIGKGVGSHLVSAGTDASDMSSVVNMSTEDMSIQRKCDVTTVAMSSSAPVAMLTPDVATEDMSPVVRSPENNVWITEHGDVIGSRRVKRIQVAGDVINPGEQAVYDALWNAGQEDDTTMSRVVQTGYDSLMKRTGFAKKTIQRIIAKLLAKDFVIIERPADIYQRTPTVYRIFDYRTILDRHARKGRTHVAKVGPGFTYVQRVFDKES